MDYFLIGNHLQPDIKNTDIIPGIATDHSAITLTLDSQGVERHGPSFWRFNSSLLTDSNYISQLKENYITWKASNINNSFSQLWEFLKFKIRDFSIQYSKQKAKVRRENMEKIKNELSELEQHLNHKDLNQINEYYAKKQELEKMYDYITDGIIIRSRATWYEQGERNSKYFLNLEKRQKYKSHLRKLLVDQTEISNPSEILNEIEKQFTDQFSDKSRINSQECARFLDQINLPKLDEEEASFMTRNITLLEIFDVLKDMPSNKTPGNDGLSREFYLQFFYLVGQDLLNCYKHAYEVEQLTSSQRKSIITLIEKPGKDTRKLNGWRPISLINVDTKILSKILVNRMKKSLSKLIHLDQYAFVSERYIGEAVRLISDVLEYTTEKKIGILFGADFESAFNSVNHIFLNSVLLKFGFDHNYIRWLKLLYNNAESCVINNGFTTKYFPLERGNRQGDPLSP